MNEKPLPRRLAAILATDVVDYTGQMARDENATIARVRALDREVLQPAIAAYRGRVFKTLGDGILAEFQSAVAAVECAARIQQPRQMIGVAEGIGDPLSIRIGIALGEVVVNGEDLLGGAVNLACRLQVHASPGDVFIARAVYEHACAASSVGFEPLGPLRVKGLEEPIDSWRVVSLSSTAHPLHPRVHQSGVRGPAIAVAPFSPASDEPGRDYLVDGIVDELVTSLSRVRWLTVIGSNSSMVVKDRAFNLSAYARDLGVGYVLTGSVRQSRELVRVTTQLAEGETGARLWSKRFESKLQDLFELHDEIATNVAGAIEPALRKAEIARIRRRGPANRNAYDFYLQALGYMYQVTPDARAKAMELIVRALAIEPDYPEAHGVAAWLHFARTLWEGNTPDPGRATALHHVRAIQASHTDDATTLAHAAIALAWAERDYTTAGKMIDDALGANPSSAHAYGHGAVIATWSGEYERTFDFAARALRLSPFDPLGVMPHAAVAGARLMLAEYDAALEAARRALQVYPTHAPAYQIAICALLRLGRTDEATKTATRFVDINPAFRIQPRAPIFEHFVDELKLAGLPEAAPVPIAGRSSS